MGIFIPKKLFSRTTKKLILGAKIWVAGTKFCCFLKLLLTCLFFAALHAAGYWEFHSSIEKCPSFSTNTVSSVVEYCTVKLKNGVQPPPSAAWYFFRTLQNWNGRLSQNYCFIGMKILNMGSKKYGRSTYSHFWTHISIQHFPSFWVLKFLFL